MTQATGTPPIGENVLPSLKRPILDQPKFNEAVLKLQRHMREQYNYTMPHTQAAGWIQGDKDADRKIRLDLPTVELKDQQARARAAESSATGWWNEPGAEPVRTVAGEAQDLAGRLGEVTEAATSGRLDQDFTASDFGVLNILRQPNGSGYMDEETGQILDMDLFNAAWKRIVGVAKDEFGITLSNEQAMELARDKTVTVMTETVSGRGAAVGEAEIELSKAAQIAAADRFTRTLAHDITMADIQHGNAKEMAGGFYMDFGTGFDERGNPLLTFVRGTMSLDEYRIDTQERLTARDMDITEAENLANAEFRMLSMTGFMALKRDEKGNPVDMNGDGRPDVEWIHGSQSIQVMEIVSRENLAALDNENRVLLAQMGIDSAETLQAGILAWEKAQLEGYKYIRPNGQEVHVYGTQEWELIGDAQRRNGFSAVVRDGVDENGRTIYRSVRYAGTFENALLELQRTQKFTGDENALDRTLRVTLQTMADTQGRTLQDLMLEHNVSESALDRTLRVTLQEMADEQGVALTELQSDLSERARLGYFRPVFDARGNPVVDKPSDMSQEEWDSIGFAGPTGQWARGDKRQEWVYGTEYTDAQMQEDAQTHGTSIAKLQIGADKDRDTAAYRRQLIFMDQTAGEAELERIWRQGENALDRTAQVIMQDTALTYDEKRAKIESEQRSYDLLIQGGAVLAAAGLSAYVQYITRPKANGSTTVAQFAMDLRSGVTMDRAYAKKVYPEFTDEQADEWADMMAAQKPAGTADVVPGETPVIGDGGGPVVTATGDTDAFGKAMGTGDDGNTYVQEEGGSWTMVQEGTGTGVLSAQQQAALPPGVTEDNITAYGTGGDTIDAGGKSYVWNPDEGVYTEITTGTAPSSWGQMTEDFKNLSARDIIGGALAFGGGVLTAMQLEQMGGVMAGISRMGGFASLIAADVQAGHTMGPMIGATAAGMLAYGIYRSFFPKGNPTKWHNFYIPSGMLTVDAPPEAGNFREAYVDFHLGEWNPNDAAPGEMPPETMVVYVNAAGQTSYTETLATYQERTGRTIFGFQGGEDAMYGSMPEEIKQLLADAGYKPRFSVNNPDGSVSLFDDKSSHAIIIEKEDVDRLFRTGGGAGSVTPSPPPIGQVDEVRGASTDDALISAAAAMSDNLGAPRIRTMSSLIPDVARRRAFLTKLARAEPFTQDDVDYIFKADPDTGVPEYVDVWQLFDQYVGANLIVMRTETEIGA